MQKESGKLEEIPWASQSLNVARSSESLSMDPSSVLKSVSTEIPTVNWPQGGTYTGQTQINILKTWPAWKPQPTNGWSELQPEPDGCWNRPVNILSTTHVRLKASQVPSLKKKKCPTKSKHTRKKNRNPHFRQEVSLNRSKCWWNSMLKLSDWPILPDKQETVAEKQGKTDQTIGGNQNYNVQEFKCLWVRLRLGFQGPELALQKTGSHGGWGGGVGSHSCLQEEQEELSPLQIYRT
jgi:hypothetical protein